TQISVALLQAVYKVVCCLLQIAAAGSRRADVDAVRVDGLAVIRTISTLGSKPNRILLAHFAPVIRDADSQDAQLRVSAKARRRIFDAASRRIGWIVVVRIVVSLIRISLTAALNLRHSLRARITS